MCSVYLCHPNSFPLSPSMGNFWRKDSKSESERTCHGRLARTKRFTPQLLNDKLLTSLSNLSCCLLLNIIRVHQCPALDLAASCHRTLRTFLTLCERFVAAYGQLSQFRRGSLRGFDCLWMPEMDSQWSRSRIVPKLAQTTQVVVYIKGTKWVCIAVPRIPG